MTKEEVIQAMNTLPEKFDFDALVERLIYVRKLKKTLRQLSAENPRRTKK